MNQIRIAITGIGLVTPLGNDTQSTWDALQRGETAAQFFTPESIGANDFSEDVPNYGARVHLELAERQANQVGLSSKSLLKTQPDKGSEQTRDWSSHSTSCETVIPSEKCDLEGQSELENNFTDAGSVRSTAFALAATQQAFMQADLPDQIKKSTGCVFGTSKTDLSATDKLFQAIVENHSERPEAWISSLFPSTPAHTIAHVNNLSGPLLCPVAACATGTVSLIRAAELIRHGETSSVVAGSTDCSLHAGLLGSYRRLGVLAKPGNSPSQACRPFDVDRSGFVVGEGAAAFTLESWDQAVDRGRKPLAEWVDGIVGCDPSGLTAVDESGETLARLIQKLLDRNQIPKERVSCICYHGTATRMNDLTEARAIKKVFGDPPIGFGIKGALGHLMGAAGAVESAVGVLALRDQIAPPSANHVTHDPECPNLVTGRNAVHQPIEYLLKTSLGFGGHLAVGLLKRVTDEVT